MAKSRYISLYMRYSFTCWIILCCLFSCKPAQKPSSESQNSTTVSNLAPKTWQEEHLVRIETGTTTPEKLVSFAKSLKGIPYKYASTNPSIGFDCSGFVTYVFNHFNIAVPRASVDFTPVEREIDIKDAKPGDLILFTGTDSIKRVVGHMGIIVYHSADSLSFIHSTSGRDYGVTESALTKGYQQRYIKTIRIFPQNDKK